jgi:hypothetical protein
VRRLDDIICRDLGVTAMLGLSALLFLAYHAEVYIIVLLLEQRLKIKEESPPEPSGAPAAWVPALTVRSCTVKQRLRSIVYDLIPLYGGLTINAFCYAIEYIIWKRVGDSKEGVA